MSCQLLGLTTQFHSQGMAIGWPPGQMFILFHNHFPSKSQWAELGSDRDRICSNQSGWPLYHVVCACSLVCSAGDALVCSLNNLKSLLKSCYKNINRQLPCKSCCEKVCFTRFFDRNQFYWISIKLVGDRNIIRRQIREFFLYHQPPPTF